MSSSQRLVHTDSTCGNESTLGARRARYVGGWQVLLGATSVALCLLTGTLACQPSSANATPPAQTSREAGVAANRAPAPERVSTDETRTSAKPRTPEYVLPFEARNDPFAPPEPEQPIRTADGQTAHTFDVKLTGLMTGSDGMLAALMVDGRVEVVRAGARLTSESEGGELRIVEIRRSEIVIEQNGVQRIVPLLQP